MEHHGTFGPDVFGRGAEHAARFFGTPQYIIGQTLVVIAWIALNGVAISFRWDPYPFILLNLAFSTQAAYAAPLILLAQTRQAERDKVQAIADAHHRESLAQENLTLLESNTKLTAETNRPAEHLEALTREAPAPLVPP